MTRSTYLIDSSSSLHCPYTKRISGNWVENSLGSEKLVCTDQRKDSIQNFIHHPFFSCGDFFALWSRQDKVCIKLAATTDGLSKLCMGTSVDPPLMLELIGQQISNPVFLL